MSPDTPAESDRSYEEEKQIETLMLSCTSAFNEIVRAARTEGLNLEKYAFLAVATEGRTGRLFFQDAPLDVKKDAALGPYYARLFRATDLLFVAEWAEKAGTEEGYVEDWKDHCANAVLLRKLPVILMAEDVIVLAFFDPRTESGGVS